jgi:hypothetical protein
MWRCRCSCGAERVVSGAHLRSGASASCGHSRPSSRFINMTGIVFGEWIVIERAPNRGGGSATWLCRCSCGTERVVAAANLRDGRSSSCNGPEHRIRRIDQHGYRIISGFEHPNAQKNGDIFEHVLVMSDMLGRPLIARKDNHPVIKQERVHHRNGVRDDNRPENLELWAIQQQPPGQRVEDMVAWAHQIINQYGVYRPGRVGDAGGDPGPSPADQWPPPGLAPAAAFEPPTSPPPAPPPMFPPWDQPADGPPPP